MIKTKNIAIQCPQCGHTDFEQPDNSGKGDRKRGQIYFSGG